GDYSPSPTVPAATPGPSGAVASLTPIATAAPGASGPGRTLAPGATPVAVPSAPPVDPNAPERFAVDLFDPSESNIAPGSPASITALGRQPGASASPGAPAAASPAAS